MQYATLTRSYAAEKPRRLWAMLCARRMN